MLVSINKTRQLELIGKDMENDENKEYYLLVKVEPTKQETSPDGQINQKTAVHNHLAYLIPTAVALDVIGIAAKTI